MTIESELQKALAEPSDIRAHAEALMVLGKGKRVVEFGTRDGMSTRFILGGRPVALTCYDLGRSDRINDFYIMCAKENIEFTFIEGDIEKLDAADPCEYGFGFIDAMHNGNSVAIYLRLLHAAGAATIALHDTEIFGESGDLPGTPGINKAIRAFLQIHRTWRIASHNPESYGFTVLTCL